MRHPHRPKGRLGASPHPHEPLDVAEVGPATRLMRRGAHSSHVPSFDELLAELLEESEEVLGALSDVVNRGRMQADYFEPEVLDALSRFDLVAYLIQRSPGRPVRAWVYPSPMGLKVFGVLEREAEREEERQRRLSAKPRANNRRRSGKRNA